MKLLLVNPPAPDYHKYGKHIPLESFPLVGLFYLHSYLKKNKYNCVIYDFFFDGWDYIESVLRKENADIIGIPCLTQSRFSSFKMLSLIRKIKKDSIVIFGGHHSTFMCDQLLTNFNIDYIVLREGENKFLNLVKAIEGKIPLDSVKGIAYRKGNKIIKNLSDGNDIINDLDSLPFPFSKEHIDIFRKYPSLKTVHPLEFKQLLHLPFVHEKGRGSIVITSRGCPFDCQFCSAKLFWGRNYRFRSTKNVVDEIEFYNKKLGLKFFRIWDYTFTLIPKRGIEICKEILNRNLKIYFGCQTRADRITEELVFWLKKAGCIFIGIGVESGSQKILTEIKKNISLKSIIRAFAIFKKFNLPAYPLLMVGNPGETYETIQKTIMLMKIIRPYKIAINKTMVFPGTELYSSAIKKGFINDDYWLSSKPQPYYTFENPLKTLNKWEFEILYYDKKKYQQNMIKFINKFKSLKTHYFNKLGSYKSKSFISQVYNLIKKKFTVIFS